MVIFTYLTVLRKWSIAFNKIIAQFDLDLSVTMEGNTHCNYVASKNYYKICCLSAH